MTYFGNGSCVPRFASWRVVAACACACLLLASWGMPQASSVHALSAAPEGGVTVSTDRARYQLGEPVTITIKNATKDTIYLVMTCRLPLRWLYWFHDGKWVGYGAHPTKKCAVTFQPLEPGQQVAYHVDLIAVFGSSELTLVPGEYQLEVARALQPPASRTVGGGVPLMEGVRSPTFHLLGTDWSVGQETG